MLMQNRWGYRMPLSGCCTLCMNMVSPAHKRISVLHGFMHRKLVIFTQSGRNLVNKKITPLVLAEERSFERLDEQEREQLLAITQKHIAALEEIRASVII